MPIFCKSIKQVLAASAFKSSHLFSPARNDSGRGGAARKLGGDKNEKNFVSAATHQI
jgi:hypothetical protein